MIPYRRLITMLEYKGKEAGIKVQEHEESYTSKCDALALESFQECKERTVKRRFTRDLYKSSTGRIINADVNGALNILRKSCMEMYAELITGIEIVIQESKALFNPIKLSLVELRDLNPSRCLGQGRAIRGA